MFSCSMSMLILSLDNPTSRQYAHSLCLLQVLIRLDVMILYCVLLRHDKNVVNIFCIVEWKDTLSIVLAPSNFNAVICYLFRYIIPMIILSTFFFCISVQKNRPKYVQHYFLTFSSRDWDISDSPKQAESVFQPLFHRTTSSLASSPIFKNYEPGS